MRVWGQPWIARLLALAGTWCAVFNMCSALPPATKRDPGAPAGRKAASGDLKPDDGPSLSSLLGGNVTPISFASTLQLAGVQNPELLLAQQRVVEAMALQQLAAAQILPNLNYGSSYDTHTGPLQQSNSNILKLNRSSMYVGAGVFAIAAGSVNIPGVVWNTNVSQAIYAYLESQQIVAQRRFASRAAANDALLQAALAYTEVLRGQGRRSLARLTVDEAREVVRLTAAWAQAGVGRQADADRAATELAHRIADLRGAEGEVLTASARLAKVLNLDPSTLLEAADEHIVPAPIVPDPIPLPELLAIAIVNRPEMQQRQAVIRQALIALEGTRVLPFSPNIIVGLSAGEEGGGSNLASSPPGSNPFASGQARFGTFAPRLDFDAVAYWMLVNGGVGNVAMIREARSRLSAANYEMLSMLDRVRAEVADAFVQIHARRAQIATTEKAIAAGRIAFKEDGDRIKAGFGRPIELLNSFELLAQSRYEYLRAIIDYNEAQISLYVALGQPPANTLARPVPPNVVPPEPKKPDK